MQQLTEAIDELRKTNANVATLLEKIQQRGVTQTVVHKSEGATLPTVLNIAMLFVLVAFMIVESRSYNDLSRKIDNKADEIRALFAPQIDQLRAWNDVHTKDIARLQAQKEK